MPPLTPRAMRGAPSLTRDAAFVEAVRLGRYLADLGLHRDLLRERTVAVGDHPRQDLLLGDGNRLLRGAVDAGAGAALQLLAALRRDGDELEFVADRVEA